MAEFLLTNGNSHYIEKIVVEAKQSLVLVTPYLKLSDNFLKRLIDADKKRVHITLVYGKKELQQSERNKLGNLENLELYYCHNLHAKCYHNEDSLVISSMNLYEFSEKNNREMGVHFTLAEDPRIFSSVLAEIESIINDSIPEKTLKHKQGYVKSEIFSEENFHLKSLHNFLSADFKSNTWTISPSEISATDFPVKGVNTVISRRILLHFESASRLNKCKAKLEKKALHEKYRIFPKFDHVYIYPVEGFSVEDNEEGLIEKTDYFRKMAQDFSDPKLFTY